MHVPLTEVILTHDGTELTRATLPPGEYLIGREAGVDLPADTPLLWRKHARLTINSEATAGALGKACCAARIPV